MKDQIPQYAIAPGSAVASSTFIMNSVYKPDGVNSTANLTGLAYFYQRVLVRRCRIRHTVVNLSSAVGARFCIYASSSNSIAGSYQLSSEQRGALTKDISIATGGPSKATIDMTCDISQFFGLPTLSTVNTTYTGTPASVPSNPFYWQIYYISDDGSTNLNLTANTELWFDAEWFGPVTAVA